MDTKEILTGIFNAAVKAVDPYECVSRYLINTPPVWEGGVHIIGFGKAAYGMGAACEEVIGSDVRGGILITKYGHSGSLRKLKIFEADHPVPDLNGQNATRELIDYIGKLGEDEKLLCMISGGGSALLCSPLGELELADKQKTTDILLKAGADIFELNSVRKHLSSVKGGRLIALSGTKKVTSLIISDVLGDRIDVIASGPTSPDGSSYSDALAVIRKYGIESSVPEKVLDILHRGLRGEMQETLKPDDEEAGRVSNVIVGSLDMAIKAAAEKAKALAMNVIISKVHVRGEARLAGRDLAKKAVEIAGSLEKRPVCLISGGETTVTVKGKGKGGRNMELALSFAREISGRPDIALLSAGTDGGDGPTDAAGAIVDDHTVERGMAFGVDIDGYLENNDSYQYFREEGGLFITGPTGTNVMDLQIAIIK
ncbi:MAG: glycerate kinase [Nitrospirota bacterium]|nr:MAG: glycerate kinase [Nitrospirota bacterium]